jgi:ectoine hydroxylase-related dioxygenase (phytanoyl-CoA dioxygenase family)
LQGVARRDQVWQITGATRYDADIARHAANPRILDIVEGLLGTADIKLFSDQTLMKPAFHGSPVSWHQDSAYWTTITPPALVSCWVALDDVTADNGPVLMVPGTHTWGVIDHARRDAFLHAQGVDLSRAVPVVIPAGACSFHHSLTVHGSGPNHTPNRRRGLVTSYMRADSTWAGDPAKKPNFVLLRGREHPGCV